MDIAEEFLKLSGELKVITREDMQELIRRMTPTRT